MFLTYVIITLVIAIAIFIAAKDEWYYVPYMSRSEDNEEENDDDNNKGSVVVGTSKPKVHPGDFAFFSLVSVVAGAAVSFIIWGLFIIIAPFFIPTTDEYVLEESVPVYALQDNCYVSLTGNANELTYLVKEEYGFRTKSLTQNSKNVYFEYIDDSESSCLETRAKLFLEGWWNIFVNPPKSHRAVDRIHVFKIPEGSIKQEYNVDMQ